MAGTLFVVATPIGNLDDISARALQVLRRVALIAAEDTRRTAHLLSRYAIATPTTSLREHNEQAKSADLIARLSRGDDIALVSDAGTPTISDPGRRLITAAIAAGIRLEPVPGPNAALTALAVSGFPTDIFTFMGFPPVRSKDRTAWFSRLREIGGTIVFFEAPHRIRRTLENLKSVVGDCEVLLARELTKKHEELVRGPISAALASLLTPRGEFTIVAYLGHTREMAPAEEARPEALLLEIGHLIDSEGLPTRRAVAVVAKRHGESANKLYQAYLEAKRSG